MGLFSTFYQYSNYRVGRACRGESKSQGHALLFLRPQEIAFLLYLKRSKVPVSEFQIQSSKIADIQNQLEKLLKQNYYLNQVRIWDRSFFKIIRGFI